MLKPLGTFTSFFSLASVLWLSGCGEPPMQTVTGKVRLDGEPVVNCKVGFFPDVEKFDTTKHGFGFGVTDEQGAFEVQHPQGESGIWAGDYKVTFVAWVDKSGKPLDIYIKPSEVAGGVVNIFPAKYEEPSLTPERVSVTSGENVFNFDIVSE